MSYTIIRPKDRAEWLSHREHGIGSSEVGTILGLNPYDTPLQLWRRKRHIDPPIQENEAMLMGHLLEDAVAQRWQIATGRSIIKRSATDWLIVNNDKPYLRVSPDRTFWVDPEGKQNDDNKGILECKSTMLDIDPENIPLHWFAQLQYQLGIAEMSYGELGWLCLSRRSFGHKPVAFDKEFFEWAVSEVEKFWIDNIQGGIEPLPTCVEDVLLRNPKHTPGKVVEADPSIVQICQHLKETKESMKKLEESKKEDEEQIKLAIGDAEGLCAPGEAESAKPTMLATWKASKDSLKFNEKKFAAEHPELYEQYREVKPGARLFLLK